jgi:hypothetical protein
MATATISLAQSAADKRRKELAARKTQALAGFTAGRTTPPKATTGTQVMTSAASGGPSTSLAAPATATRWGDTAQSMPIGVSDAGRTNDAYAHLTPAVQESLYGGQPPAATYSSNPTGSGWNNTSAPSIDGYLKQFGYTPQGLTSLYENPSILANDVLGTRGITNAGMGNELAELFDMFHASQFVNNRGGEATDNDILNYVANAMQQAVTPGGEYVDPYYYMRTILGQPGGDKNPLSSFLTGENLTPDQQMSRVNQLIANGMPGMGPYAQQAYGGFLQNQQDKYREGLAKGAPNSQSYFDFLQNSQLGNWIR